MSAARDRDDQTVHVPRPLTSFIGREQELAVASDRLRRDDVRLLTLTGPGGVGKTRLAIRVAERMAPEYPHGIWFVPLAAVRDPALVASTIARTLEVPETGDRPIVERIAASLADRRGLLILDNFEHVLGAGPLLIELLAACPGLTMLVTSRTVLRLSGEHAVAVPPLSLPRLGGLTGTNGDAVQSMVDASEAVRLFLARASAADAAFALTSDNAADIAALCARLDGLPLAIELAAARVPTLPPQALLRRVDQRLRLLTGGVRDHPVRLRSMRDAIAWSYDLLSAEEQALFRRLAIFVGSFTLEAAEAVCKDDSVPRPDVLDGIGSLYDKSLLRQVTGLDGEPRYQMLETVREFGVEQLNACGEESMLRDAHLAWALACVEQVCPAIYVHRTAAELDRLEPEHDNLRAALTWALERRDAEAALRISGALRDFWYLRGYIREGHRWLGAGLAIGDEVPPAHRARALLALGEFANDLGDSDRGTAALRESLELSRALGDRLSTGVALDLLGCHAEDQGDYATAERLMTEARACFEAVGGRYWLISQSTFHLGVIAQGQGHLDLAMARYEEAQRLARAHEDHFNIANTLWYQGLVHCARGELARAAEALDEALAMERALGSLAGAAPFFANFAVLAVAAGQFEAAARLLGTAEGACDRRGMWFGLPERIDYDRARTVAQAQLGEAVFRAAWDVGWSRSIEEAAADIELVLATARSRSTPCTPSSLGAAAGLTAREMEVLRLVAAGHSNREIADALFISVPTVKRHLTNILGELELPSRSALNTYAHSHGLV
jgi:predicted ATPase/DNA-binding CsgD family transcriptional regulator